MIWHDALNYNQLNSKTPTGLHDVVACHRFASSGRVQRWWQVHVPISADWRY